MMGVGKTTIGKIVAKKLKLKFVDIDSLVEKKEKNTIKEIFRNKGEDYFRKIEAKITLLELKKINLVIALGGGAFINKSIRKEVSNSSVSFWLDLELKSLINRLKKTKKRPLLDKKNLESTINKIYLERKKIYNESNFKIKCNFLKKDEVAEKIVALYENSAN